MIFRAVAGAVALLWLALAGAPAAETINLQMKTGKSMTVVIIKAEEKGVRVRLGGGESVIAWDNLKPASVYEVRRRGLEATDQQGFMDLGDYCMKNNLYSQARRCFDKVAKINPARAGLKQRAYELRGAVLRRPLKVKIKKKSLFDALKALGRASGAKILVDAKLAKSILDRKRKLRPVINYTGENESLRMILGAIIDPLKLKYLDLPVGIVVYSQETGIGPKTLEAFNKVLREAVAEDCIATANIIAELNEKKGMDGLVLAAKHADPRVRQVALVAMRALHEETAVPIFLEALKDPHVRIRMEAISGLSAQPTPAMLAELMTIMEKDDHPPVTLAQAALLKLDPVAVREAVRQSLKKKKIRTYYGRRRLVEMLGQIGDATDVPMLLGFLQNKDKSYRYPAPFALALLGARASIPAIAACMEKYKDDFGTVNECCRALAALGGDEALGLVVGAINSTEKESSQRTLVSHLRYSLPNRLAAQAMQQLMLGGKESLAKYAALTLGTLGDKDSIEPLVQALEKHPKWYYITSSLRRLTGQKYGYKPKKWREWWDKNKAKFELKRTF